MTTHGRCSQRRWESTCSQAQHSPDLFYLLRCCWLVQLVARLVGHKVSINALISIAGKESGSPEWLVSGGADGSMGVWDLARGAVGVDREIAPRHMLPRAHDGPIFSLTLFQSALDSPENPPVRLLTTGKSSP